MRRARSLGIVIAALSVMALAACGPSYRGEPLGSAPVLSTQLEQDGRVHFDRYCSECHPGGSAGLAPGLNNKPLPGFLVRMQVRVGMGAMPPFPREVISDEQLDAIVAYTLASRK